MARLLPKMLPHINLRQALYRGEFVGCLALIDHRGPPIDMDIFPLLADERTWGAMRDAMVPAVDAHYQVYERNSSGEWSFNHDRFELYLKHDCASCATSATRCARSS